MSGSRRERALRAALALAAGLAGCGAPERADVTTVEEVRIIVAGVE